MVDYFKKLKDIIINRKNRSYIIDDEEYCGEGESQDPETGEVLIKTENVRSSFLIWFYIIILVIFSILFTKLWILQVVSGEENRKLAEENRIRSRAVVASRGLIYDTNRNVLAKNIPNFVLVVYPVDVPKEEEEKRDFYRKISEISGLDFAEIRDKVEKNIEYYLEGVAIKENITHKEALILEEKTAALRGVAIEKRSSRGYVVDMGLAHILGYVGDISEKEYEENLNYLLTDKIGKTGVESYYEKELKGIHGREQVEVDSFGRLQKIIAKQDPLAGSGLVLNIDSDLQKKTKDILSAELNARQMSKGVAIISNPQNGAILSMVSLPDYDNNVFSSDKIKEEYPKLVADPQEPLFNRVISGVYPPGSTIKPVIAAAALQENVVGVNDWIICKGVIEVPNQFYPDIIYHYKDWAVHGGVNVTKALAESCNVFFYTVGGGHDKIQGLGLERIVKYLKLFGLNEKTGIDLGGEAQGLVPNAEWKKENLNEVWVLGDTYNLSIGQGHLGVTPLQVNAYTAAIANGGTLYKPRIAKELIDASGSTKEIIKPEIIRNNFINIEDLTGVRSGMRSCVTSGSCDQLQALSVSSAGKTGTAQSGKANESEHSWFTAFAPYDNPQIVITVMIENGGEGYQVAEPISLRIMQYYFSR